MFNLKSIAYQKGLYNWKGMKLRIMQILAQLYKYIYVCFVRKRETVIAGWSLPQKLFFWYHIKAQTLP